jgi:hypothetical protein
MSTDTENTAPSPDVATDAATPEPAKRPRRAPAKKAADKDPPIALDLVLPPPAAERGFELDEDPVYDPVPKIEPATYVNEVFAVHRADFGKDKEQADLIVFDPEALAALPEDVRAQARLINVATPEGLALAEEQKEKFRQHRLATERTHKRYKQPFYRIGKLIDETKNSLVEAIAGCEDRFGNAIKAEQERQQAEREALIQVELARVAALRQRVEDIRAFAVQAYGLPAATVRELVASVEAIATDAASFTEYAELATQAKADTLRALAAALVAADQIEAKLAELTRYQRQFGELPPDWSALEPDEQLTATVPDEPEAGLANAVNRGLAHTLLMCYRCLTGQSSDTGAAISHAERMLRHAGYTNRELIPPPRHAAPGALPSH